MIEENLIASLKKQFDYYQLLANKTIHQIPASKLFWKPDEESNSIAIIMKHMAGNMLSRWTDFLTTDGEKAWRHRDAEFEIHEENYQAILDYWEKGWSCLHDALNLVTSENLQQIIYIRNEGHTLVDALLRQLAHYPYHVGQIVFLGKMIQQEKWQSLSIPKGNSQQFNHQKFSQDKGERHFTDSYLSENK